MVAVSSQVFIKPDWDTVEKVADSFCNVRYKRIHRGATLALVLKQDLVLTDRSEDLFANYSLQDQ